MRKEFTIAEELNTFIQTLGSSSFQMLTETNNSGKLVYIVTDEPLKTDSFDAVFDFSKFEQ